MAKARNGAEVTEMNLMKEKKVLTMESSVKTLALKFYEEQIPDGIETLVNRIKSASPKKYQIAGIKHDRDYVNDDVFNPSMVKPHYVVYVRVIGGNSVKVRTLLNIIGVVYRDQDRELWENHGVETCRDFSRCLRYLTHDTEKSVDDGKTQYGVDDIFSNLSTEEILSIRNDSVSKIEKKNRVGIDRMEELDRMAKDIGYNLEDFDEWYYQLSLAERSNARMKQIKESYYRGIEMRVMQDGKVNRLCIFIRGEANIGKTYAATEALKDKSILCIGGGGSGKFDRLNVTTDAIIVDDDKCQNLLNMCDNYICQAYRRGSNNPYWCGNYFIVTYNNSFEKWLEDCGITDDEQIKALKTRFYICEVKKHPDGSPFLHCSSPSIRGSADEQQERKDRYMSFSKKFNDIIKSYKYEDNSVDYSDLNEEYTEVVKPEIIKIPKEIIDMYVNEINRDAPNFLRIYNHLMAYRNSLDDILAITPKERIIEFYKKMAENPIYQKFLYCLLDIYPSYHIDFFMTDPNFVDEIMPYSEPEIEYECLVDDASDEA